MFFGVDASNGEILWKVSHGKSNDPNMAQWDLIKCTTPLCKDGMVYVTGGYDTGGMMIKIASDGKNANVVWTDSNLDNHHGGVVLVDGYIYGSNWITITMETGAALIGNRQKNVGRALENEGIYNISRRNALFIRGKKWKCGAFKGKS